VELDQAPPVLPYHAELARPTLVECVLDERTYEKGIKVSDAEMPTFNITGDAFHPEWNYSIMPRKSYQVCC